MSDTTDTAVNTRLDVVVTLKDGITIGMKNLIPILINVVLWLLTCWIPYLNVGTTIGLAVGIVTMASKGEMISATEIFNPKYRKYMGEFFLTGGLMFIGVLMGLIFGTIPGFVIALAWSLSILMVIDKGKNPTEALTLSNNLTYGHKWKIFAIYLLLCIASVILTLLFAYIWVGLVLIVAIALMTVLVGLQASIYRQLTEGVD